MLNRLTDIRLSFRLSLFANIQDRTSQLDDFVCTYVNSEGSGATSHLRSLVKAFTVRSLKSKLI